MKLPLILITAMSVSGVWAGMEDRGTPQRQHSLRSSVRATISGIEEGGTYGQLPPVLVELARFSSETPVWVELHRGTPRNAKRGVTIESRLIPLKGGKAILDVPGITNACSEKGTWTIVVMSGAGLGQRPVAATSFEVRGCHFQDDGARLANEPALPGPPSL